MTHHVLPIGTGILAALLVSAHASGQWVSFVNETDTRFQGLPELTTNDTEEKDYAWGDVDQDGDDDLIVVRKEPFSTDGGRINVLLMNEGIAEGHAIDGVLVDRTQQWGIASTDGTQGLRDATADRDVVLADVNDDGWLDIVTAPTYGQGLAKTISHPRVYINLGENAGVWQGFRYEEARIPQLQSAPNTCGVAAGNVTDPVGNDSPPDLYFVTYGAGLEDFLLVNDGTGNFTDESNARLTNGMRQSGFGTASEIEDMDNDGWNDVVKSENGPVKTIRNGGDGFFNTFETSSSGAHYHMSTSDLNNDGMIDIIISDDGQDRFLLNQGPNEDGLPDFQTINFTYQGGGGDDGFGSNSIGVDLNLDGFRDVLITDVDVDFPPCNSGRRMHIFRNLGDLPDVTMVEQMADGAVGGIPLNMLRGVHDVAVMDINRDTYPDLVIGRCSTTEIWINQPPTGLVFGFPDGLPSQVPPDETFDLTVQILVLGSEEDPVDPTVHTSVNDGGFTAAALTPLGGSLYTATLPAAACVDNISFYFSASLPGFGLFRDPVDAPLTAYRTIAAAGNEISFEEYVEGDVSGWTVINDPSLTNGAWEQADPIATFTQPFLEPAAPGDDNDPQAGFDLAFVTENGEEGGAAGAADVDGGPTYLISPVIDLTDNDATIFYARWFFSSDAGVEGDEDFLFVDVSNDDGDSWVNVETLDDTDGEWRTTNFVVSEFVEPTATVRVRFWTSDDTESPGSSIVEAGLDTFIVERFACNTECPTDINGDGVVGPPDLAQVLENWGANPGHPADFNGDGVVGPPDLAALLESWGPCS